MCQEQILILSCSSPSCPPLSLSLSPSHRLCLSTAFLRILPSLSKFSTPHPRPPVSLICFPSKSSSYFIPFLVNAVSPHYMCVSVCKPSRCLSLSLSDVQQLLEGTFSLPLKHTHSHTNIHMHTLILCTSFNLH